jgi:hypothetical protein
MPKVDPRNEVGVIVHTVSKNDLGNHTSKIVYRNVNYTKTFIQGIIVNVFNGCVLGGDNSIWKLTVHVEMPSNKNLCLGLS